MTILFLSLIFLSNKLLNCSVADVKKLRDIKSETAILGGTPMPVQHRHIENVDIENKLKQDLSTFQQFMMSFSLNMLAEVGDKSFVTLALLYNQVSNLHLFLIASFSELIMTIFSVLIGNHLKAYPGTASYCQLIGSIVAFIFAAQMIWESFCPHKNESEKQEVEAVEMEYINQTPEEAREKRIAISYSHNTSNNKNQFFKILNIAWMITLSELGDISQITTIILTTKYNVIPIFLGNCLAHLIGIVLSMTVGYILSKSVNKKFMTITGAICFIFYGTQMGLEYLKTV
jgi:putative Ca2+/H+ antiporter (TMEM165/GDT1 family)